MGGWFTVDVTIKADATVAVESDDLNGTINYASVAAIVKEQMQIRSALLEHVAGRIAHAVQTAIPEVLSIDLKLTKCNPPMGADCAGAGVEIHLINDKTRQ